MEIAEGRADEVHVEAHGGAGRVGTDRICVRRRRRFELVDDDAE
jgi:hypothetical protein